MIHIKAGLNILADYRRQHESMGSQWQSAYAPLLLGIGIQAAFFINPKYQSEHSSLWTALAAAGPSLRLTSFRSLGDAQCALSSLTVRIFDCPLYTIKRRSL